MKKMPYEKFIQSFDILSKDDDAYVEWIEEGKVRGWKRNDIEYDFPIREYCIVNGREVSVYTDNYAKKYYIFDNDPSKTVVYGENVSLGIGTFIFYNGRYIKTSLFREISEEFSSAKYSTIGEIACIMDLFFDDDSLSVGNIVNEKMNNDENEKQRVYEIIKQYKKQYGEEISILLTKYGIQH
jgi:hypothetical protein